METSHQWFKKKWGLYYPKNIKGWMAFAIYFWMIQEWIWYFSLPKFSHYSSIVVPVGVIITTLTFFLFCKSRS